MSGTVAATCSGLQSYFYELADFLETQLQGSEVCLSRLAAEESDFVRFNHATIRQAMRVVQRAITIQLIDGGRHATAELTLCGQRDLDWSATAATIRQLRDMREHLPSDPYLLYAEEVRSSVAHGEGRLPPAETVVSDILDAAAGTDMVGIYAAGGIFCGFANSLGQRNWFSSYSYNFDWSLYHSQDKAVKSRYAGFDWRPSEFAAKMQEARDQLRFLSRTPRTIAPGEYRVYLSPLALSQFVQMLCWSGFSLKEHRSKQTCLLKMVEESSRLDPQLCLLENTEDGVAPNFQECGFIKPAQVNIIDEGKFRDCLVSPRSAREYGVPTNGANEEESPESLDVAAGLLPMERALEQLGTGLYINNLWYLNFSDRGACRITGMTRFATFWVEKGTIAEPVNVMRFDDTAYRVLGHNLLALTAERELILDARTFYRRSTGSSRMPGALVEGLTFTL